MNELMNDCLKPELSVHLSDCYFVVQRLLFGIGVLTSQLRCYVHSIVCHTCVGLRFDMPLIKRILIDRLIHDDTERHCNAYIKFYSLPGVSLGNLSVSVYMSYRLQESVFFSLCRCLMFSLWSK